MGDAALPPCAPPKVVSRVLFFVTWHSSTLACQMTEASRQREVAFGQVSPSRVEFPIAYSEY
jgi:hypothetical protein